MSYAYTKSKKRQPKDLCVFYHFTKQFNTRFYDKLKIKCSEEIVNNIIKQIKRGESIFIKKQSTIRTLHIVKVLNTDFKICVVYNKNKEYLHTCFPIEWLHDVNKMNEISEFRKNNCTVSASGFVW